MTSHVQTATFFKGIGSLTKPGIVILVVLCALAGFGLGYTVENGFDPMNLVYLTLGITLLSAGSLSLNQMQEWEADLRMPRTRARPIPSGVLSPGAALAIGLLLTASGLVLLFEASWVTSALGLLTVVMYNLFYTLHWKPKWAFAAVPGAVPGAMPVVIGYSASHPTIFTAECMYVFLIMFLWQMPHFWALAIRYRDDYQAGGFPVLPVAFGVPKTLFHIGVYTFAYVALACASPFFVEARYAYAVLVFPFALKVIWEFLTYFRAEGKTGWLPFFLWTNASMLIFLVAPVVDKWVLMVQALNR